MVLATTATTATAGATTPAPHKAHYCKQVDAYRLKTCATALLPAGRSANSCAGSWTSSPGRPPP